MKNTTKLRNILQLYTLSLDMDDEEMFRVTMADKRNSDLKTFSHKEYTVVIGKAFSHMMQQIKAKNKKLNQ